jgi:hypothetical protein
MSDLLKSVLADIDNALADHDRKRQEIKFAPWQMALTFMTAGAALFGAAIAFVKVFG